MYPLKPSQSNGLIEILGYIYVPYYLCILCFWALYIAPTYMLDYIYRPLYLKYWALYRDHYSSPAFCYLGYICRPIFIMGFCNRKNMQISILGYIYVPLYSGIPNFLGFIYSPFYLAFSFFLIMGFICGPYCVCWFVFWGDIYSPLPRFRGPRVLRRKNRRSPLGLRGW